MADATWSPDILILLPNNPPTRKTVNTGQTNNDYRKVPPPDAVLLERGQVLRAEAQKRDSAMRAVIFLYAGCFEGYDLFDAGSLCGCFKRSDLFCFGIRNQMGRIFYDTLYLTLMKSKLRGGRAEKSTFTSQGAFFPPSVMQMLGC